MGMLKEGTKIIASLYILMHCNENYLYLKFYSAFILGVRLDRVRGGRQKYRRCQESPYQVHPIACKKPSLEGNF